MTFWAKPVQVQPGTRARWDFGSRHLWIERRRGQWLAGGPELTFEEPQLPSFELISSDQAPESDGPARRRVAVQGEARAVQLVPRPPPRPIIARPELPLVVPPGEATTIYVGVPLWIAAQDGAVVLDEVPAVRLSDTWFGSPTQGELCFATRTSLRMELGEIVPVAHRALCVIDVRNEGGDALVLERVRLPAPSLVIDIDGDGNLWTSPVRLRREKGDGQETTEVLPRARGAERRELGPARQPLNAPLLGRVFNVVWMVGGGA
jgi:hypothetical protein